MRKKLVWLFLALFWVCGLSVVVAQDDEPYYPVVIEDYKEFGDSDLKTFETDYGPVTVTYLSHKIVEHQLVVTVSFGSAFSKLMNTPNITIPIWTEVDCNGKLVDSKDVTAELTDETMLYLHACDQEPTKIYVYSIDQTGKTQEKYLLWSADDHLPNSSASQPGETERSGASGGPEDRVRVALSMVDESYRAAYEAIKDGETIKSGSQGETVRTVQQILNEFGFQLPLTGGFYNQSLGTLQTIQTTFGWDTTDEIDAAMLEKLLIGLTYVHAVGDEMKDPMKPFDELNERYGFDQSMNAYMGGAAYELKKKYYRAYELFELSDAPDASERMNSCVQKWPATGEIYRNPAVYGTNMTLTTIIGKKPETAALIKIYRGKELASVLFLGKGDTVSAYLPGGVYSIRLGMGSDWFGLDDSFGREGYYEQMTFDNDSTEVSLDAGYVWTLRINTSVSDPEADSVGWYTQEYGEF